MEMDPQIDAKQVPNLANVYSGDLLHEPAFDIEEYLNFDDTDDAQLTDPAGSPLPSAPNQQLNLPNPSGESELNHAGNSSTGEAGSEASGGIASAQLGTLDLGPLDPATRLDLLRHIALLRNSPHFVLPDPKRQRIDSASSTAAINQPEIQMHTPGTTSLPLSLSRTQKSDSGSGNVDSKAEPVYIPKATRERQEIETIIEDPNFMRRISFSSCERVSQKAFARIEISKSCPEEANSGNEASLTKEAIKDMCSVIGGPDICEEIEANWVWI
ncbi:hypothetical protein BJ085DRAFT_40566 [Dimargaris cristalligena]|uniref:Uncharacterized protein n=1 Tax=Dimargaris cristalligena TaxID=215637 RepID=A0A4P9ZSA1_9FUNG|nr:hypothetical protein BJ085DRAFT_40566 [Dimargaris cristalligena]|eukprot:RKP36068.1 hypothetical protein BJ085DRAFT_40566 [Dimargaris cristalligena]